MIDINNSRSYDEDTERSLVEQELRKSEPVLAGLGKSFASDALVVPSPMRLALAKLQVKASAERELTDPVEFMKRVYPGRRLFRFVLSHPDLDHMSGVRRLYEEVGFVNCWDTNNTKSVAAFFRDGDKANWESHQEIRASGMRKLYMRGDSHYVFGLGEDGQPGGDNIEILSPTWDIVRACNEKDAFNDISLVLRVHHAGRSVLLPGDAERLAWDSMVEAYGDALKSDFLKASHHGRDSGYHMEGYQPVDEVGLA